MKVKSGIGKEREHDFQIKITQVGFKDISRKGENERSGMKEKSIQKPDKRKKKWKC